MINSALTQYRAPNIERRATTYLPPTPSAAAHRGVTLIELLITISILAILAALILGASAAATEAARRAKTKTVINKIHALVMERYETYRTRRVDVEHIRAEAINRGFSGAALGMVMADARLFGVRELMRLEMPDRWSDIATAEQANIQLLAASPALTRLYQRRYDALLDRVNRGDNTAEALSDNQHAECLYLTVMHATGDGEARTHFGEQDIGDVDGDGAPEFLDGWGNPIHFIRWPAGFAQESSLMASRDLSADRFDEEVRRAAVDHDPFDVFRRDQLGVVMPDFDDYPPPPGFIGRIELLRMRNSDSSGDDFRGAFRLLPLIYSAGPDGDPDLHAAKDATVVDPYIDYSTGGTTAQLGAPLDGNIGDDDDGRNWIDNVHNHLLDNQ
ncbi:prepilin-type N-terminal cleavage/methylation domain-containing protein [Pirellulales bacterium]|nr:prepilin-type N-terminal cleavage/methylation domain-containing protein [Pirellulales bacterium]